MIKRIALIALTCLALPCLVQAQDGLNTSYFLSNLPQRFRLNPAYQPEYKAFVGLPGLSGISINYLNSSFTPESLLQKRADSIYMNIDKLYNGLYKNNFLMVNNENSILTIGFKAKSWYATIDVTQKNDVLFRYNKDIFTFLKYGNADYPDMDFGKLGLNLNSYLEIAVGLSKKVNEKLTVGGRFKYLTGIANLQTTDSDLGIRTQSDGTLLLHSRQNIRVTAPVHIRSKIDGKPFPENDFIDWDEFDINSDDIKISDILNVKNPGIAFDLGGEYKLTEKINLYASITDLGFIMWRNKDFSYNFHQDAEYEWKGADISGAITGNENAMNDAFDKLTDDLKSTFKLQNRSASYISMLNPKLHLGATYQLHRMVDVSGLFRASMMNNLFLPSFTAAVNARFIRNISASVSYSVTRGSYANIGAGLTAKLGPIQLYVQTDNLLACNYTNTKSANARLGINLLFGHKDKRKKEKTAQKPKEPIVIAPVPVKKDTVQKDTTPSVLPKPEPKVEPEPVAPIIQEEVKPVENLPLQKFYVIIGSFEKRTGALSLQRQLKQMGFADSTLLLNEEGMYRVSASCHPTHDECWDEVFRIRKKYPQFKSCWGLTTE